jgi:hypothetical protein
LSRRGEEARDPGLEPLLELLPLDPGRFSFFTLPDPTLAKDATLLKRCAAAAGESAENAAFNDEELPDEATADS